MKIALVYKSSTGFTERYAKYIAEETGADLFKYTERKIIKSCDYDILVFGSSIIAARISGVEWFDKVKKEFKHSYLFVTGANPKENNPDLEKYLEAEKAKGHDAFYMPGGLNYEKMSTPIVTPEILPMPPVKETPPTTQAAMASVSQPWP